MTEITEAEKKQCKKCIYRSYASGMVCCSYIEITGEQRNSPVGVPCNKFVEGASIYVPCDKFKGKGFKEGAENPRSKEYNPPKRKKKRKSYSELTEEQKEIRREAARRWRLKNKEKE